MLEDDVVAVKRVGSCIEEVEVKRKPVHRSLQIDRDEAPIDEGRWR